MPAAPLGFAVAVPVAVAFDTGWLVPPVVGTLPVVVDSDSGCCVELTLPILLPAPDPDPNTLEPPAVGVGVSVGVLAVVVVALSARVEVTAELSLPLLRMLGDTAPSTTWNASDWPKMAKEAVSVEGFS